MRLLLFSDIHCSIRHGEALVAMSKDADVVIGAGDVGHFRSGLDRIIPVLSQITKPCVLVPGNCETTEELESACAKWEQAIVLHENATTIDGLTIFGIGGGIPITPFGPLSYDFTETDCQQMLKHYPPGAILVSHSPPYGAVDTTSSGQRVGSRAVRDLVDAQQPPLVVCGHIHGSWEQHETIGETVIINAGPRGILYDLAT